MGAKVHILLIQLQFGYLFGIVNSKGFIQESDYVD